LVVPPIWQEDNPRDERQRQEIVARNVRSERRRSLALVIGGLLVLACMLPAVLAGLPGLGIIIVPTGMFMVIGGGIQLLFERG
jgi:predicted phage tail protein